MSGISHTPGAWEGDGINEDEELVYDALDILGFFPQELEALAEWAERETYVWLRMAQSKSKKEDRTAFLNMSDHFRRRGRRWRELVDKQDEWLDEEEEDGGSDDLPDG